MNQNIETAVPDVCKVDFKTLPFNFREKFLVFLFIEHKVGCSFDFNLIKKNDDKAALAQNMEDIEPVIKIGELFTLFRYKDVEAAFRKKELMVHVLYLLASEIPDTRLKLPICVEWKAPVELHVNACLMSSLNRFEIKGKSITGFHKKAIEKLINLHKNNPNNIALIICGSIARNEARPDSDVDL